MKVLGNRILIKPIAPDNTTPSGLIMPAANLSKQPYARVVQLGSGKKIPTELAVGQLIRVDTSYGSQDVKVGGALHRIVSVLDVQVVFDAA